MAKEGNCIFVGRCSDYILRNRKNCINIFLRGNEQDRVDAAVKAEGISEAEAKKLVSRADKKRRSYYNYYTNREWGNISNYDISLNLSKLDEDGAIEVVLGYIKNHNK
jgi:cytidylate kinase